MTRPEHFEANNEIAPVMDMTQQMMDLAESSRWEELIAMEKVRDQRIKNIRNFKIALPVIEQILVMDASICKLAEDEKSRIKQQLLDLNKGKNAIQAYTG